VTKATRGGRLGPSDRTGHSKNSVFLTHDRVVAVVVAAVRAAALILGLKPRSPLPKEKVAVDLK